MTQSKGYLYDPKTSRSLVSRPRSHEEADRELAEIGNILTNKSIKEAFSHFVATASLREKMNMLNSRSYFLPHPAVDKAAVENVACQRVCEQACRLVCNKTTGGTDPGDCHDVCHEVCSCVVP
jgi:hypothetical protein